MLLNKIISDAVDFFKKDKRRTVIVAFAVLGMLLVIISLFAEGGAKKTESRSLTEYKRELEGELSELCSSVRGVGRCRVTVTFSEGEHLQYKGSTVTGSTPPKVMGVSVVCDGADKDTVREALSECICSLFDIRSNRVSILKMK